eukprot:TRINITY_DN47289_c0_g1_i1.p1 TRINITY_DN47289_c0_g1~~TRINITY_DN47289_c0_g1_i1.p1  ORF type:complete len:484 (+),score=158.40 TRINITY_DN47289_c0_g1_i1:70-1521(+)
MWRPVLSQRFVAGLRRSGLRFCCSPAEKEWQQSFHDATVGLAMMDVGTISYEESAARMRSLLKGGLLTLTDLHDNPERFFYAHRSLARHAPNIGPGFWIRFTVHYNLFAGTILALGTDEQRAMLASMQQAGELGCFALTERFAGVNSGMVVETIADYDRASGGYTITSPSDGSCKNWISQGLVADKAVVVADLRIDGKSKGPHAFLMDFRRDGQLVGGVTLGDMGRKTIGNDLDNAWIRFDGVKLPGSSLLSRFADIVDGEYVQKVQGLPVFHMIGQRLFTGRVAVAQAALQFRRRLFEQTQQYSDAKRCWAPGGKEAVLSGVPQLKSLYAKSEEEFAQVVNFVAKCEQELCASLRAGKVPSVRLVEAIAVAKVRAVETSIRHCFDLKQEVGSYALMGGTGFEQIDFLVCCKFAEGDSRILMQKMARDMVNKFRKKPEEIDSGEITALCKELAGGASWDENWELVYELADLIMKRTVTQFMSA